MDTLKTEGYVKYLVKWKGWLAKKHQTWELYKHFYGDGVKAVILDFYQQNSGKPRDQQITIPTVIN